MGVERVGKFPLSVKYNVKGINTDYTSIPRDKRGEKKDRLSICSTQFCQRKDENNNRKYFQVFFFLIGEMAKNKNTTF